MPVPDDLHRSIGDIAAALRDAKERNQPCSVLIGAGCSVSAGIPLALGFVDEVKLRYVAAFRRARQEDYPHVMRELDTGPRYRLIAEYVERANLNWAHILLGWLVKNGYIGRILTTNFDNLVLRACSLYGVHPAVYDLAATSTFKPSFVRDPAVFFLHGQYGGFVQLHTREEVEKNAKLLRPAFENATVKRPWLVVGYSGYNDPVFENLADIPEYADGLYWVGYRNQEPSQDVQTRLLSHGRQAYLVAGYDADMFFVELFRELKLDAPPFVTDPFSHLLDVFNTFIPFPLDDRSTKEADITHQARAWLSRAQSELVLGQANQIPSGIDERLEARAFKLFAEGNYDGVIELHHPRGRDMTESFRIVLGAAYSKRAKRSDKLACSTTGEQSAELHRCADADYEAAIELRSDDYVALNNWAVSLMDRASRVSGAAADALLKSAEEKLCSANVVNPGHASPLYNLACACALRGDVGGAVGWLRRRMGVEPKLRRSKVEDDPAFDRIRESVEFRSAVEEITD
ncbi:TPR end-of-group domain-containing protein [Sorangium sp. So ce1151]|uniref:TPR end-of-group domain-containing protein n=1 Tax=Sorangium sp. So ce1151 TaxID=3133332 RepID=UPI003F60CED0